MCALDHAQSASTFAADMHAAGAHAPGTHLGATLVFPLPGAGAEGPRGAAGGDAAAALRARIGAFRARVDAELPGMYCWLADGSLHVTLRALMG
jgi:hypothetical protein